MKFIEYLYATWYWHFKAQNRKDPGGQAVGCIAMPISLYLIALVVLGSQILNLNSLTWLIEHWPLQTNVKYLRPTHALGLLTGVASFSFVSWWFRASKREEIARRFFDVNQQERERVMVLYFATTLPLVLGAIFSSYLVVGLVLAAHLYFAVKIYRRY